MECWWAQPSSHDGSVHVHSRARSVRGTQVMAAGWDFVNIQDQLDGIVRNKVIYQKVATALGPFSTLDPFSAASSTSSSLSSACCFEASHKVASCTTLRTDMKTRYTYLFSPCHMTVTCTGQGCMCSRSIEFALQNYSVDVIEADSNRIREFTF